MERPEFEELYCIQPIANLQSIAKLGILSHNAAAGVDHVDLSMAEVQDLRASKRVPDARVPVRQRRWLHDYANLYFCARNPMLYKRLDSHEEIAVLRISVDVLDLPGVVVTDGNAASHATRFDAAWDGVNRINRAVTYAQWWTHNDPYVQGEHRRRMCAEVLVPDRVPPEFILGVQVSCETSAAACVAERIPWPVEITRYTFFS